jgi:hypothetical protein
MVSPSYPKLLLDKWLGECENGGFYNSKGENKENKIELKDCLWQ